MRKNMNTAVSVLLLVMGLLPASVVSGAGPHPGRAARAEHVVFRDCPSCPEMVVIPGGRFLMGSDDGDPYEWPLHEVWVEHFALGRTEVTQEQWRAVMGNNPGRFSTCGDDCPVERVSWQDAQAFVKRLSAQTGKQYRLPNEAEWEYACRARGTHVYCGSNDLDAVGWHAGNSQGRTHPVARRQANAFGLHDMSGNVWEWVEDCWNRTHAGAGARGRARLTGNCGFRMLRGGGWRHIAWDLRASKRMQFVTALRNANFGLRVARTLPQ